MPGSAPAQALQAVAALTALGLLGYAAFLGEQWVSQGADSVPGAIVVIATVVVWGVGVIAALAGLRAGARWASSLLMVTWLLLVPVGLGLAQGDESRPYGVAVLALSVTGLVLVGIARARDDGDGTAESGSEPVG